ncbi:hypothetical protein [Nocardia wallacei]|uniref:hypothetical protein n=1 Tax=Nocardia wallacei TaxID=480035 RepID=UPI0024547683|nr:hypothetical protein [Nocardia wallacei]
MSKRLIALFALPSGAVLVFALGLGFLTPAASSFGVPTFVVGVVSCALLGAGLGTVPNVVASRRTARERRDREDRTPGDFAHEDSVRRN